MSNIPEAVLDKAGQALSERSDKDWLWTTRFFKARYMAKAKAVLAAAHYAELVDAHQALRDSVEELLEVARLRGDNELPHPENDPKLWTARMQTAWDDLQAAMTMPVPRSSKRG